MLKHDKANRVLIDLTVGATAKVSDFQHVNKEVKSTEKKLKYKKMFTHCTILILNDKRGNRYLSLSLSFKLA